MSDMKPIFEACGRVIAAMNELQTQLIIFAGECESPAKADEVPQKKVKWDNELKRVVRVPMDES